MCFCTANQAATVVDPLVQQFGLLELCINELEIKVVLLSKAQKLGNGVWNGQPGDPEQQLSMAKSLGARFDFLWQLCTVSKNCRLSFDHVRRVWRSFLGQELDMNYDQRQDADRLVSPAHAQSTASANNGSTITATTTTTTPIPASQTITTTTAPTTASSAVSAATPTTTAAGSAIGSTVSSGRVPDIVLNWIGRLIGQADSVLEEDVCDRVFMELLPSLDCTYLSPAGFQLQQRLFLHTNYRKGCFVHIYGNTHSMGLVRDMSTFRIQKLPLVGLDTIWNVAFCCQDEQVATKAMALLEHTYNRNTLCTSLIGVANKQYQTAVEECMSRLQQYREAVRGSPGPSDPRLVLQVRRVFALLDRFLSYPADVPRAPPHQAVGVIVPRATHSHMQRTDSQPWQTPAVVRKVTKKELPTGQNGPPVLFHTFFFLPVFVVAHWLLAVTFAVTPGAVQIKLRFPVKYRPVDAQGDRPELPVATQHSTMGEEIAKHAFNLINQAHSALKIWEQVCLHLVFSPSILRLLWGRVGLG